MAPRRFNPLRSLPLVNPSRDSGQEFFAEGMTEALRTDLGKARSQVDHKAILE